MSLPESWVNRIFQRLTLVYGQAFMRQWEGLDVAEVKALWGEELTWYQQQPSAIAHALENLPIDRPPNVLQFRDMCRKVPAEKPAALPDPAVTISPEVIAETRKAFKRLAGQGNKDWADALKEREARSGGKGMTLTQRKFWREALGENQSLRVTQDE